MRIVLMDDDPAGQPSNFRVDPARTLWAAALTVLFVTAVILALILLTPVRTVLPGYTTLEMQRDARLNQLRLSALEDSLARQQAYMGRLRDLMLGNVDTAAVASRDDRLVSGVQPGDPDTVAPSSENWLDHQQPAVPIDRMSLPGAEGSTLPALAGGRLLTGMTFPLLPPVTGIVSREFDARTGHFAIDIVVEEGSVVRSIGDGYVVVADWTHDAGQIIAVQHADGYISIYKHNSSLLKRVGDAVRSRDAIALSGNSGEITTGPHLHFELWHNGLAQDPRYYLIGL